MSTPHRAAASGGILFVVLQMASQALIQVDGMEPPFAASGDVALAFFAGRARELFEVGAYLSMVSLLPFLAFLGVWWAHLRRAEGAPGWLSATALGSGLVATSIIASSTGWSLAMFRIDEGLDPAMARMLFDQGNLAFANFWVFLAGLLLASGAVGRRTGALPAWLDWTGVLGAVGLLAARAAWASTQAVFVPYAVFLVWIVAASVVLMRSPAPGEAPEAEPG